VDYHAPASNDARSLRELARIPELRALLIEHAGRGFRVQAIVRGVLAAFVLLTIVFDPPHGAEVPALLIACVYCVWAIAVYIAVRVNDERVLRLNWIALIGDVVALGAITLTAAGADNVSWTGDILLNGFFLVPVLAAVQLRVWVAVTAVVPALAVFLVCSALARQAEAQPWSYVLLRLLALAGLSIGCVLLVRVQGSRVLAIGNTATHRSVLLVELLDTETRERAQLSEDLHDGALQYVLAARHDLDDLPPTTDPAVRARLSAALTEASERLRSQVSRLTPAILDHAGLVAAIRRLADDASERGRFINDMDATSWSDGPTPVDRLLFDCAREFLSNVVMHADASTVRVVLSQTANAATLVVSDDGTGVDPSHQDSRLRAGHVGLATRRIRIEAAGGTLSIDSSPGGGTTVTVRVPLDLQ
jgi:two-component system, NarL family, sensor kinase